MQDRMLIYRQNFVPWNWVILFFFFSLYFQESKAVDLMAQQKNEGSSLFPYIEMHTVLSSCFNPQSQSSYYSESWL